MDESRVRKIAVQIARALEHADQANLVHRDVKPDNILLTKDGVAKLCDLGLAKDGPEGGVSLGTPNYIAPEQAKGLESVDIRADLYSFGATLYHMLTGQTCFQGTSKAVMVKHLSETPAPIRSLDPDVSDAMVAIVEKLLKKEPEARFQKPAEVARALESSEAAAARQPEAPAPQSRRRRR